MVTDDALVEGNESFDLIINSSSLPSRVTINDAGNATVIIVDDESRFLL